MPRKPATPKTPAPAAYDRAAVMEVVLDRIAGGESLREICKGQDMPDRNQVNRWMHADKDLHERYLDACRIRTYHDAEEVVSIADNAKDAALARVQIDARKWRNAHFNRVQFGDKLGVDGGTDGSAITVKIVRFGDEPPEPADA